MTLHLGNVPASSTLYIPFATYDGATGASEACSGLAVTDIEIYKNGSVTQRASDAGYTLLDTDGIDFDGLTGINGFSIDLSDNTDASFYSVGGFYWVIVSSITADTQTVNFIAATFRIVAAEAISGKPKVDVDAWLGTAAATPTVNGVPEVDITHIGGTAVTAAAGIPEVKVASIANNAIAAAAIAADAITAVKIADGAIDAATFAAGAINAAAIATGAIDADALAADALAEINAEVVDALNVDTYAEPGQEAPGATVSLAKKISYLYKAFRNKKTQTSTTWSLFADDATTVDQKSTVSDDATTATRGEIATGP
jgi:hypothetical protein